MRAGWLVRQSRRCMRECSIVSLADCLSLRPSGWALERRVMLVVNQSPPRPETNRNSAFLGRRAAEWIDICLFSDAIPLICWSSLPDPASDNKDGSKCLLLELLVFIVTNAGAAALFVCCTAQESKTDMINDAFSFSCKNPVKHSRGSRFVDARTNSLFLLFSRRRLGQQSARFGGWKRGLGIRNRAVESPESPVVHSNAGSCFD